MQPGVHKLTPLLYTRRRKGKTPSINAQTLKHAASKQWENDLPDEVLEKGAAPGPPTEEGNQSKTSKVTSFVIRPSTSPELIPTTKFALTPLEYSPKTSTQDNDSNSSTPKRDGRRYSAFDSKPGDGSLARSGTFELQLRAHRRRASQHREEAKELSRPNTALGTMDLPSLAGPRLMDPLGLTTSQLPARPNTSLGFSRSVDWSNTLSQATEAPIISSWNPRNFQLHWHQDLTEQAPDVLPSWIWQRQNLRVLLVGGNKLQSIPPEIGLLQNLNEFVAFNNKITEIPPEVFTLSMLQKLDLSFNHLYHVPDQIVELFQLREIKLGHNRLTRIPDVLVNAEMPHLELLDVSHNRLVDLPRHLHNVKSLQFLDVSHNNLSSLPAQFRLLERLEMLDVSYNCLDDLPINELKLMLVGLNGRAPALNCIECRGNPLLTRPPPEINEQGGRSVALYLRASVRSDEELQNTDMVMVVYGEKGSGKTSMIQALSARSNRSRPSRRAGVSHGVDFSTWAATSELSFSIIEVTAQTALSSQMLQLFLVRRSIYVLVWAARECIDGALPEWEITHMTQTVNNWIDAVQHAVPGASVLLVASHVEQVSPEELQYQSELMQRTAQARLEKHRRTMEKREVSRQKMPILNICRDCSSFEIDSLKGTGVADLRSALIAFTKSTPWYRESIPTSYMCLRDALRKHTKNGRKVWMSWREYRDLAVKSGIIGQDHLRICTVFLNDIGILRFFGDVDRAQAAEKLAEKHEVLNSVYISLEWVVDVMKGLFQSDRGALLDFFSRGRFKDKHMYLRVRRLLTRGVVHPTLAPFLWPLVPSWPHAKDAAIQAWWAEARGQGLYEDKLICSDAAGLRRVLHLVEGLDIGAITQEEGEVSMSKDEWLVPPLVVPGLLSDQHRLSLDARVFSGDCLYRIDVEYLTLPPGFFNKLLVSLRRQADHIDFNTRAAALYSMGTKLQVFMARKEGDPQSSSCVTALFSSTQLWEPFKNVLQAVERLFPGLHRIAFNYRIFADIHDDDAWSTAESAITRTSSSFTSNLAEPNAAPDRGLGIAAFPGSEESIIEEGEDLVPQMLPSPTRRKTSSLSPKGENRKRTSLGGEGGRRRPSIDPDRIKDARRGSIKSESIDGIGRSVSAGDAQALLEAGIADRRGSTTLDTPLLSLEGSLDRDDHMKAKVRMMESTLSLIHNPTQVLLLHSASAINLGIAAETALHAIDPTLEVMRRVPGEIGEPNDIPLLMVLLVDRELVRNAKGIQAVRAHVASKRSVIPLLVPGYEFGAKSKWWPDSMPELDRFGPAEDIRYLEEWADLEWKDSRLKYYKLRPQMLEQLHRMAHTGDSWAMKELLYALGDQQKKEAELRRERMTKVFWRARMTLRNWRGDPPPADSVDHTQGPREIPCLECIRIGEERPANFDRRECIRVLDEAEAKAESLNNAPNPWRVHRPANTTVTPWVTCAFGHLLGAAEVLESACTGVYDSVTCPSCMRNGMTPPGCFNRNECLAFFRGTIDTFPGLLSEEIGVLSPSERRSRRYSRVFEDRTSSTKPVIKEKSLTPADRASAIMRCPKCLSKGFPGPRVLDVLAPEVFLSYSVGREMREDGETKFATEELVKSMRGFLEETADVLCWMDDAFRRQAAESDPDQIEIGIDKAVVVVAFLSDEYVRSETCRRELHRALIKGKYILPVLVQPIDVLDEGGWSGKEEGEDWWKHAKKILTGELTKGIDDDRPFSSTKLSLARAVSVPQRTSSADSMASHANNAMEVDWEGLAGYTPVDLRQMDKANAEKEIAKRVLGRFHRATQVKKQAERARQVWRRIKMVKSFWAADRCQSAQ